MTQLSPQPDALISSAHIPRFKDLANPRTIAADFLRHRHLIWQFTLREIQGRYRGSSLGLLWALLTPLFMLAVYTLIFGTIQQSRWLDPTRPAFSPSFMDYALNLFTGLIAYNIFAECANRAPSLILSNPNYVKKVVFPLEILPVSLVAAALIHSLLSLAIAIPVQLLSTGSLHLSLLYLPLVFIPLIGFSLGVCWFLAILGVFLRDIQNLVSIAVQLLFFLTPVVYPMAAFNQHSTILFILRIANPLISVVENFRRIINYGLPPAWPPFLLSTLASFVLALAGYLFFQKLKPALADVI